MKVRSIEEKLSEEWGLKNAETILEKIIEKETLSKKEGMGLKELFDDEKLVDAKDYNEIIEVVNSIYKNPQFILLDEIQNIDKWELFVNRLHRQNLNLIVLLLTHGEVKLLP